MLYQAEVDASYARQLLDAEPWQWLQAKLEKRRDDLERQIVNGEVDAVDYALLVRQRKTICAVLDLPGEYTARYHKLVKERDSEQVAKGTRR